MYLKLNLISIIFNYNQSYKVSIHNGILFIYDTFIFQLEESIIESFIKQQKQYVSIQIQNLHMRIKQFFYSIS